MPSTLGIIEGRRNRPRGNGTVMSKVLVPTMARSPERLRTLGWPVLFALLVGLGGQIRIPIPGNPVPLTLQVVFVLLAGAFLRPAAAAASMILFVTIGLLGAPVFAGNGAGVAYLMGSTGGYLVGFVAGAASCALILQKRRDSVVRTIVAMSVGLGIVYLMGAGYLALFLGGDLGAAWRVGVLPFLGVGAAKLAIAVVITLASKSGTSPLVPGSEVDRPV